MRSEERRQQHEQDDEQEVLVNVPEEEEQVGEARGGDQAAHKQEVHATGKSKERRGKGTAYEPPSKGEAEWDDPEL